jgi:hypothetical protein
LGACGDDDDASAPTTVAPTTTSEATTTAPATSTTSTAPATTAPTTSTAPAVTSGIAVPPGADPAVAIELQAAIDAYDRAYALATAAPGDPSHVEFLAATTDGELRQGVQAAIGDRRAAGEALRPGRAGVVVDQRIEAVEALDATAATVVTCLFNGSERYNVASGEVLDGSQVAWQNKVELRRGDDGQWRVDAGERVGDSREVEVNPCT